MYAHYKHNSTPFDTKEKRRAVSILLCQRSPLLFYNYAAGSMCALWSANFVGKFGIKHGFTAHHAFTLIVLTPFPPLPPPSSPPITFYFASSFFLLLHACTDTRIEAISPRVIHSFQKIMIIITVIQSSNEFYYTSNNKSLNAYIITTRAIVLRCIPCTLTSFSSSLKPPLSLLLHAQLSYLKENISTFIRLLCLYINKYK